MSAVSYAPCPLADWVRRWATIASNWSGFGVKRKILGDFPQVIFSIGLSAMKPPSTVALKKSRTAVIMWLLVETDRAWYYLRHILMLVGLIFRSSLGESEGHSSTSRRIAKCVLYLGRVSAGDGSLKYESVSIENAACHFWCDLFQIWFEFCELAPGVGEVRGFKKLANLLASVLYQCVVYLSFVSVKTWFKFYPAWFFFPCFRCPYSCPKSTRLQNQVTSKNQEI